MCCTFSSIIEDSNLPSTSGTNNNDIREVNVEMSGNASTSRVRGRTDGIVRSR